jgi:MFS family permease
MAVLESVSDTAGTTVLQTDPPPHLRGRVLGVWGSVSTVWGLGGPPLLGLLMELAGARGALATGGLVIAGTIGAGFALRGRRTRPPAILEVEKHEVGDLGEAGAVAAHGAGGRPGLSTAA